MKRGKHWPVILAGNARTHPGVSSWSPGGDTSEHCAASTAGGANYGSEPSPRVAPPANSLECPNEETHEPPRRQIDAGRGEQCLPARVPSSRKAPPALSRGTCFRDPERSNPDSRQARKIGGQATRAGRAPSKRTNPAGRSTNLNKWIALGSYPRNIPRIRPARSLKY